MGQGDIDWSARRADARRNHERVLAAAIEVFTELGLEAPISEVAARAGVGKATVFRSYPTKADLIRAIAEHHAAWLRDAVVSASDRAERDAYAVLLDLLRVVMTRLAEDRLMLEVLSRVDLLEGDAIVPHLERILEHGRAQGSLRDDVSILDVQVLVAGAARSLIDLDIREPQAWQRYAGLALAALRP